MTDDERRVLDFLWNEVDTHPEQTRCARRAFRIHVGLSDERKFEALRSLVARGFVEVDEANDFGFVFFRPIRRAEVLR